LPTFCQTIVKLNKNKRFSPRPILPFSRIKERINVKKGLKLSKQKVIVLYLVAICLPSILAVCHSINGEQDAIRGIDGLEVLNIDGNVSLPASEDEKYWNPHVVGFTEAVIWNVSFTDEVLITLETVSGESGHIATGMWWTAGFKSRMKIPLYNLISPKFYVDFDIKVDNVEYEVGGEWLRIALACAVQRDDGSVVYTEMDLWDSPNTQRHTRGNVHLGGDIIYHGGDVVEFKIDQIPVGVWRHYHVNLTGYIDRAWRIRPGDGLESVYIVIESDSNPVKVLLRVDNLWIRSPSD